MKTKKSFNIQELLHHKSKHHGTKPLSRAFQRHQDHDLKHPGSADLITTKTKQTTFLHRLIGWALCHATPLQWLAFL
jgi:hypothetical protein